MSKIHTLAAGLMMSLLVMPQTAGANKDYSIQSGSYFSGDKWDCIDGDMGDCQIQNTPATGDLYLQGPIAIPVVEYGSSDWYLKLKLNQITTNKRRAELKSLEMAEYDTNWYTGYRIKMISGTVDGGFVTQVMQDNCSIAPQVGMRVIAGTKLQPFTKGPTSNDDVNHPATWIGNQWVAFLLAFKVNPNGGLFKVWKNGTKIVEDTDPKIGCSGNSNDSWIKWGLYGVNNQMEVQFKDMKTGSSYDWVNPM